MEIVSYVVMNIYEVLDNTIVVRETYVDEKCTCCTIIHYTPHYAEKRTFSYDTKSAAYNAVGCLIQEIANTVAD